MTMPAVGYREIPTWPVGAIPGRDGRGLGRLLIETLTAVGAARGVERFTYEIVPGNHVAQAFARRLRSGDHAPATRTPDRAAPKPIAA